MEIAQSTENQEVSPEFDAKTCWRTIRKRKWIIIAVFLIAVVTVWARNSKMRPIYKATTRIVIDKDRPNIVSVNEVLQFDANSVEYLETQFEILKSRSMVHKIIATLGLEENSEFKPIPRDEYDIRASDVWTWVGEGLTETLKGIKDTFVPPKPELLRPPDPMEEELKKNPELRKQEMMYQKVVRRLNVKPIRGTRLVDLSFTGSNPVVISQILNKLTEYYVDQNLASRLYASEDAVQWLDERLAGMQNKVEQSERELQNYSKNLGVVSLEETQELVNQRVAELTSQVIEARRRRAERETLYKNSQNPNLAESLPEIINNPLIQEINKELSLLESRGSEVRAIYGPRHPKRLQVEAQIQKVMESIAEQTRRIHGSIYTEYQMAQVSERSLIDALEEEQRRAAFLNDKSIRYGVLKRDAATNRQLYDLLLKRLKETDLSLGLRNNNIRVIDRAMPSLVPFKPDKKKDMIMAMIFGLVGGLGLAFFIEYLDNTVKEPDEISIRWGVPFLGLVADHTSRHRDAEKSRKIQLIAYQDPASNIAEALRTIRTNILFSSEVGQHKAYMITSALPGEGKTTVASNLAIVMASLGEKVLLIDADLRRPSVHKLFTVDNSLGLSSYLIRQSKFDEVIMDSGVEGLTVIPSGFTPPNPAELLSQPQMRTLMKTALERFDRVIVDTPPIASVTDPIIVSKETHAVIMVMRCGVAPRNAVTKSLEQLRSVNANIMGAILNAVDFSKDSYYYQYYFKHYYTSGNKEKERKTKAAEPVSV